MSDEEVTRIRRNHEQEIAKLIAERDEWRRMAIEAHANIARALAFLVGLENAGK